MSVQQRPGLVTALAVMNFIFGGLGIMGLVCAGLLILLAVSVLQNVPAQPGAPNLGKELGDMFGSIPGYVPFLIVSMAMGLIMSIVLIVSGFGLLKLRNWARILCFVYAVYTILSVIGGAVYQYAVVQPAMEKWAVDFQKRMQDQQKGKGGPAMPAPAPPPQNPAANMVGGVVSWLFSIAYAVALLVILNLPDIRRAFSGAGAVGVDDRVGDAWEREPRDRPYEDEGRGRLRSDDDRFGPADR